MTEAKTHQSRGGLARAKVLSAEERSAIASTAARMRWANPDEREALVNASLQVIVAEGLAQIDAALDLLHETRRKYRMIDRRLSAGAAPDGKPRA
jgi:hypothetical protein